MKLFHFVLLAAASAPFFAFAQQAGSPAQGAVGRYQALEATFTNPPDAAVKQSRRFVILDTVTGNLTACDYVYNDAGKSKEDGLEYWGANGICRPFSSQQGWYITKASKKQMAPH